MQQAERGICVGDVVQVWNIVLLLPHSIAIVLAYPTTILQQGATCSPGSKTNSLTRGRAGMCTHHESAFFKEAMRIHNYKQFACHGLPGAV